MDPERTEDAPVLAPDDGMQVLLHFASDGETLQDCIARILSKHMPDAGGA